MIFTKMEELPTIRCFTIFDIETARINQIDRHCIAEISDLQNYRHIRVIGQSQIYLGSNTIPCLLNLSDCLSTLKNHRSAQEADYVIDAIDYFSFPDSVALHRSARKQNKFVITAVALGFGTSVLTFSPHGMSLERYLGIPEDLPLDSLKDYTFPPSGYADHLPSYVTRESLEGWLSQRTIPTISVGQALGPGVLVSHLILHLLNRRQPAIVPEMFQLQFES